MKGVTGSQALRDDFLVTEMPDAGEDHGHSQAVGGGDHIRILDWSRRAE